MTAIDKNICEYEHVHDEVVEQVSVDMPDEDLLCDSTRIRILSALTKAELCVCDICTLLNMTKSAVSHQLRILRQSKLVRNKRVGKEVYYSLDDEHVYSIINLALDHLKED